MPPLSAVKDTIKALTVNGVAASEETVLDGTYEIQRPFNLVTARVRRSAKRLRPSSTSPPAPRPPSSSPPPALCLSQSKQNIAQVQSFPGEGLHLDQ